LKRWYFPLARVRQVDDNGCGIACVATVCGATYWRARSEFFPRRRKFCDNTSLHVAGRQMKGIIRRLGFSVVSASKFRHLRKPAIMVFEWGPDAFSQGQVHGVVWDPFDMRIIDPGYDHDRNLPNAYYFALWRRSGYPALVITGKRH
jgi:hypothetical protein